MKYDPEEARAALLDFKQSTGLNTTQWAKASGVSEATVRKFEDGTNRSMGPETYGKLAIGATKLLNRPVSVIEFSPAQLGQGSGPRPAGWHLELIRRALCPELPEMLGVNKNARWADITELSEISSRLVTDVIKITRLPRAYLEKRDVTGVSRADLEALHLAALDEVLSKSKEADPSAPESSPPPPGRAATRKRS